jgi:3-methyladenine DNA glycosylase AlkD
MKEPVHDMSASAVAVTKALRRHANRQRAKVSASFFKTGTGEYGEGDVFIGVRVPDTRTVAKRFSDLPIDQLDHLLASNVHEERMVALLILVDRFEKGNVAVKKEVVTYYLDTLDAVNNWDLVDLSCYKILGPWLDRGSHRILDRLAASPVMWHRRIAIVTTLHFIRNGALDDTFRIADVLLDDAQDLMHKAVGWMLREAGKKDRKRLVEWLAPRYRTMPRTMLRYAIERFPEGERKRYLKGVA